MSMSLWSSMWSMSSLVITFLALAAAAQNNNNHNNGQHSNGGGVAQQEYSLTTNGDPDPCPNGEPWCSGLEDAEKFALAAITSLHRQLDDDMNGNIDLTESDEFLREELKYEKNVENRQKAFHKNDDAQVSVRELWSIWRNSEVHNWTVEQTVEWLVNFVGLPQYQEKFSGRGINGTILPILAVNHNNFLQSLGIKDSITRQRIAVKAMDVVLFGPPRDNTNRIKDVILTTLLALASIACYLVYKRYQFAQEDLSKMSKHMAELSKAEEALSNLQRELEKAKTDQSKKEAIVESSIGGDDPDEVAKLREENMVLRSELHRAEVELQDKCWVPPPALQHWLQYTYELELKTYNKKKNGAEKQLKQAKDACDKLKKKRSSLMGAFVTTHGRSIDDVDKAILEARTALTEITHELQERMHRWKQVELLIGCSVMNNPGIQYLESLLKVYGKPSSYAAGPGSVISNSQDDIDDDGASSIYCPSAVSSHVLGMGRSKSASSLRERSLLSREPSSKDSSNGEEDGGVVVGESSMDTRRVTFRADHRSRMKAFSSSRTNNGSLFDSMDNEEARRVVSKALSQTHSFDSLASLTTSAPTPKPEKEEAVKEEKAKEEVANGIVVEEKNGILEQNGTTKGTSVNGTLSSPSPTEHEKGGNIWSTLSKFVQPSTVSSNGKKKKKGKGIFSSLKKYSKSSAP